MLEKIKISNNLQRESRIFCNIEMENKYGKDKYIFLDYLTKRF